MIQKNQPISKHLNIYINYILNHYHNSDITENLTSLNLSHGNILCNDPNAHHSKIHKLTWHDSEEDTYSSSDFQHEEWFTSLTIPANFDYPNLIKFTANENKTITLKYLGWGTNLINKCDSTLLYSFFYAFNSGFITQKIELPIDLNPLDIPMLYYSDNLAYDGAINYYNNNLYFQVSDGDTTAIDIYKHTFNNATICNQYINNQADLGDYSVWKTYTMSSFPCRLSEDDNSNYNRNEFIVSTLGDTFHLNDIDNGDPHLEILLYTLPKKTIEGNHDFFEFDFSVLYPSAFSVENTPSMEYYKNFNTDVETGGSCIVTNKESNITVPSKYGSGWGTYDTKRFTIKYDTNKTLIVDNDFYRFVLHYARTNTVEEVIETDIEIIICKYNINKCL